MSFTYDLDTLIGQVRFHISDTDSTDTILTDEEIQFLLNKFPNERPLYDADNRLIETAGERQVRRAAVRALEIIGADPGKFKTWTRGRLSITMEDIRNKISLLQDMTSVVNLKRND